MFSETDGNNQLMIATEHEYQYPDISIEGWSAANCCAMAGLPQTDQLDTADIELYLVYIIEIDYTSSHRDIRTRD